MISSVLSAASGKRTSFASSCDRDVGLLLMQEFRSGCPFGAMGAAMFGGLFSVREREGYSVVYGQRQGFDPESRGLFSVREREGGIAPFRP